MEIQAYTFPSEEEGSVVIARTSRSPNTFAEIAAEVQVKGHKQFLETNVLGYGHDSVAEGAVCPWVGLEDISDLAANVIACSDPQLRVQMTSTRFQDMMKRPALDGKGGVSSRGEEMKQQYSVVMNGVQTILEDTNHPRKRTLQCDIARAFLPAGISTQMGIRGDARTMRDAVAFMRGHELLEVQQAGLLVYEAVKPFIETLFDRHLTAAPSPCFRMSRCADVSLYGCGVASFSSGFRTQSLRGGAIDELVRWRDSGWRRRFRLAASPAGPYWSAALGADWGAYRDLRRNRTIHQTDVLPSTRRCPDDALWAFREMSPDLCKRIDDANLPMTYGDHSDLAEDPYVAPMGSLVSWDGGGHIFNWAYLMRARSGIMCHPGYMAPTRELMGQMGAEEDSDVAAAMGIVASPKSFRGVEFTDRVPA